ncbi:hypothetical protein ACIGW7_40070 [Streptomyces sp. NPDC053253]|uniref:hypothetical protein n=1 Tax=Streptomyces sp. NPDC053253 TaxID=3365699 RepID=UPI0037D6CED2
MIAARLNRIAAAGTAERAHSRIRLADGHFITVTARPDSEVLDEVFLAPGLTAPDTEGWWREDSVELFLTHHEGGGRLYLDVPVEDVRQFIQDHLGEHEEQDQDDFPAARFLLNARSHHGQWAVFVEGERVGRIFLEDGVWYARAYGSNQPVECEGSEAAAALLVELADQAAGRTITAEQALRTELAARGVTPHTEGNAFFGFGGRPKVLAVIGLSDGPFPDLNEQPYVLLGLRDSADGAEVTIDRPVKGTEEWVAVLGNGTFDELAEIPGQSFPSTDVAAVAAYVARWRHNPFAVWDAAMTVRNTAANGTT